MTNWFWQLCISLLVNPTSAFPHHINACPVCPEEACLFSAFFLPKGSSYTVPYILSFVLHQIKATVRKCLFPLCAFGLAWNTEDRPNLRKGELYSIRGTSVLLHRSRIQRLFFRDFLFLSCLCLSFFKN